MGIMRAAAAAESYDRDYSNRMLLGRIWGYFRPWLKRFNVIVVMVTLLSIMGAAVPIMVARGVEVMEDGSDATTTAILLVAGVLLIGILTWAVNWVRRVQTSILIGDVILSMRHDAFHAVMNHDLSFFDKLQSGRIVSRVTDTLKAKGLDQNTIIVYSCRTRI